ncbi:MAG: protein jag [Chloroflexi bacterium]|nr:protein jag [Chloroflexota bacterium]
MDELEVSAKNIDDAITQALNKLNVDRSKIEVEVINKGKQGILGFGAEDAKIRVKLIEEVGLPENEVAGLAKEVLRNLLISMQISADVQVRQDPEESKIVLDVVGDNLGILIGRRGSTLSSIQYIVNLIVSRKLKTNARIMVDIEKYRERRFESLRVLAIRLAEEVKTTRRPISLEPMPANERRIVHMALRENTDVVTLSVGQGEGRKVVISLKK